MKSNEILLQWNNAANKYSEDQEKSEFVQVNKQIVQNRFRDLSGKQVLDLGCGYGYYTNYFREIGANSFGIDGSDKMIEISKELYPKCSFTVYDITEQLPYDDDSFDLVFCNQVLMDIENIDPIFSECKRILKKNGILYYSIVHPVFYCSKWLQDEKGYNYAKCVDKYIKPYTYTNHFWGETEHFHRPISYYLNLASKYGFILKHTEEPAIYDGITKNSDLPLFFFAEYVNR